MKKHLFCAAVLFLAFDAAALPVLQNVNGAEYLDFKDGRKAVLTHAIGKVYHAALTMREVENTCVPTEILATCQLHLDIAAQYQYLRWIEHMDKIKIGQVVHAKGTDPTSDYTVEDDGALYFWYNTLRNPQWASFFKADEFSCDRFDWTNSMVTVGNHLLIQSWASEAMLPNPETGTNENQTFAGVFNMELAKTANNTLAITKLGAYRINGNLPPYLTAQVASLTVENSQHQQCQITFEMQIQGLNPILQDPNFRVVDAKTEVPITQSTEMDRFGTVPTLTAAFLSPLSSLKAE